MKGILLGVLIAAAGLAAAWGALSKVESLSEENALLRRHAAARERVQRFGKDAPWVDMEAVSFASYNWGTPASLLVAMRQQENGAPQWEFGHKGKTAFIAQHAPLSAWQACEAARTANKALWKWALSDKKRAHEAIKALAKAYTAEAHAPRWAKNVEKLEYAARIDSR